MFLLRNRLIILQAFGLVNVFGLLAEANPLAWHGVALVVSPRFSGKIS